MLKINAALVVTILVFAGIVAGQTLTYFAVPNSYSANAGIQGSDIVYEVSTNSSVNYTVLAYDNAKEADRLFIYYDESYAVRGITHKDQKKFISQTISELKIRNFRGTTETVNAERLGEIVGSPYVPGDAVLMTSGVLPDTVYDNGTVDIFDWVKDGGSLYWIGQNVGAEVAAGKTVSDVPGYQTVIFGAECINPSEKTQRATVRSDDPLSKALMIDHDDVRYGLDVNMSNALSLGFEYEYEGKAYGSAVLAGIGGNGGMICVLGGSPNDTLRTSLAQIISSGVSNASELIESVNGSLVRNKATGTLDVSAGTGEIGVHIRMGSPNLVYARTLFF